MVAEDSFADVGGRVAVVARYEELGVAVQVLLDFELFSWLELAWWLRPPPGSSSSVPKREPTQV